MPIDADYAEVLLALMALGFSYHEAANLSAEDAKVFMSRASKVARPEQLHPATIKGHTIAGVSVEYAIQAVIKRAMNVR